MNPISWSRAAFACFDPLSDGHASRDMLCLAAGLVGVGLCARCSTSVAATTRRADLPTAGTGRSPHIPLRAAGPRAEDVEGLQPGATPLIEAAALGELAALAALVAAGADIEAMHEGNSGTAVMWASRTGQLECVRALVDAGCLGGTRSMVNSGRTALHEAAAMGHAAVLEYLLAEGGAAGLLETRDEIYGITPFLVQPETRDSL